jgi:hypothetical protein
MDTLPVVTNNLGCVIRGPRLWQLILKTIILLAATICSESLSDSGGAGSDWPSGRSRGTHSPWAADATSWRRLKEAGDAGNGEQPTVVQLSISRCTGFCSTAPAETMCLEAGVTHE